MNWYQWESYLSLRYTYKFKFTQDSRFNSNELLYQWESCFLWEIPTNLNLPRIAASILMNWYQWESYLSLRYTYKFKFTQDSRSNSNELLYQWESCFLCEIPAKKSIELTVISSFNHRRSHRGVELAEPYFNTLATWPRIND